MIVYAALVVLVHLAGERELAQVNSVDLVVLLLISNVVQNAMIGDDNSVTGGLIGGLALVVVNCFVARFLFRRAKLDRLIEGQPAVLIRDGQIVHASCAREPITEDELLAALRRQGVADPTDVEQAILETSGAISMIPKRPTPAEERQSEIMARVDELLREERELRRAGGAAG